MAEYIEREMLRQEIERIYLKHFAKSRERFVQDTFKAMFKRIDGAPAADVAPVVHGRWIPVIDEPTPLRKFAMLSGYKCSVCGRYENQEEPYCNCGARMDGE